MSRIRQVTHALGKSGIAFVIALALYFVVYRTGPTVLTVLDTLVLIALGIWLSVRSVRFIIRHSLWSLRNRLLFVYALIGVLPIVLILVLVGLSTWALMSELAVYLASAELDRRLAFISGVAHLLEQVPPPERTSAIQHIIDGFQSEGLKNATIRIRDLNGDRQFPPDSPPVSLQSGWGNVNGLLYRDGQFYGWSHVIGPHEEITALAPLPAEMIANLAPDLGDITLYEDNRAANASENKQTDSTEAEVNPDPDYRTTARSHKRRLPPAANRFDVVVRWFSVRSHYDWGRPNKTHTGLLMVQSRPSAVFRGLFSGNEVFRGILFGILVGVAVFFIFVELVALVIGFSLSTRITIAINQLYEGTRRVTRGDFRNRIAVHNRDQLGELAESFNQMTGTLERLVAVEKEKERLQTELEIAREVQEQLYPKEAPPAGGLQLSVRCDPARMVSGDYYDYQVFAKGKLAFAIGDVAGKGISAALLMATLHASLRAQISQYEVTNSPNAENDCEIGPELNTAMLISQLNKQIFAHTAPEKYATFFFAVFDESTSTLTYTNAGHLSPLLIRDGEVTPLDSNGTVVGAFPFSKYDESCLTLNAGDLIVCYTDGITEPENAYGEMFGEDRLVNLVERNAHQNDPEVIRIVMEAVRNWTGTTELFDDMTLLLARNTPQ